jgi:regulator of sirC expression with transglutaminase-like and TPR domain
MAINAVLAEAGIVYEDHSSEDARRQGHSLFGQGLARHRFDCAMYVYFYLGVAERLGLPLRGIAMPEHLALRWQLEGARCFDWEPTVPSPCDDAFYVKWKGLDAESVTRGVYLRDMTREEVLASAFYTKALVLDARSSREAAQRAAEAAVRLAPQDPDGHNLLGLLLCERGDSELALLSFDRATALDPGFALAHRNRERARLARGGAGDAAAQR